MNKTIILVAGGTSVVSLAAGAAGGYFFAKKKFDAQINDTVDAIVAEEVEKAKTYYAVRQMDQKPDLDTLLVVEEETPLPLEAEATDEELAVLNEALNAKIEPVERAAAALTDYRGFADQTPADVVESNIFSDNAAPKKKLPPRDEQTGKFRKREEDQDEDDEQQSRLITAEEFMIGAEHEGVEYDQESLLYFVHENTLVLKADYNESVDEEVIGRVNLTLFPQDDEPSVIFVRNDTRQIDYEITRTEDSLAEAMGFGEVGSEADDDSEYALQD